MNLEEFNVKIDALFAQAVKGELTYESLKHALRALCIQFENALIMQGLNVDIVETELDVVVFLCDG